MKAQGCSGSYACAASLSNATLIGTRLLYDSLYALSGTNPYGLSLSGTHNYLVNVTVELPQTVMFSTNNSVCGVNISSGHAHIVGLHLVFTRLGANPTTYGVYIGTAAVATLSDCRVDVGADSQTSSASTTTVYGIYNAGGHLDVVNCIVIARMISSGSTAVAVLCMGGSASAVYYRTRVSGGILRAVGTGISTLSTYGLRTSSGSTMTDITLDGVSFTRQIAADNGTPGTQEDVYLDSSGVMFNIQNCQFYKADILIGGTRYSSYTAASGKYMPPYANQFSVTP